MPIPITIGDETFSSKSAVTGRCQAILYDGASGSEIVGKDARFVAALFQMRPDKLEEIGSRKVLRYLRQIHRHNTPCFFAELEDGVLVDISFMKVINSYPGAAAPRVPAGAGA